MTDKHETCPTEIIRRHEEILIKNQMQLQEFMRRYDDDKRECSERYRMEREETLRWRSDFKQQLADIQLFIAEMKPNYKRIMAITGLAIVGAFGLVFKLIWAKATGQ